MDCSMPGFPAFTISWSLLKLLSIESMMPSNHFILLSLPFSCCPQSVPASGSIPVCPLFASGDQSFGASASASVLPMNIQNLFPLGLTGLISLQSMGLSRVLGRTSMTNLDSVLKSRDITLPTKVRLVKAVVFPVVTYGCESWTVKKAER